MTEIKISTKKIIAVIIALIFVFMICAVLTSSDSTKSTDSINYGYGYDAPNPKIDFNATVQWDKVVEK